MEWNREEGIKAKEIAEKKLIANDIMGAKKFALKAQTLYPNLEGISKLILTIEVYICAENKINGVVTDWYGILGVDPKADDDTIRKQYRKLALMLHPDKNNSIGADDAFKLILEAWNLLSNKEQRDAYDKERNKAKMSSHDDQNVHSKKNHEASSSKPAEAAAGTTTKPKPPENSTSGAGHEDHHHHSHSSSNPYTFWTVCHWCKMEIEYFRCYVDCNMLCFNCLKQFLAVEIVGHM
ncbi:hypothetical protein CsatB_019171 [Cannabis sativa]|uniref:uncharacterized protein LOC115699888 n=1 Tax=Cannabis sativa TaxID=3483 RepID=UPI0011E01D48|nr:uncharacterized protein LOC115699888 [Cannabis sativa]